MYLIELYHEKLIDQKNVFLHFNRDSVWNETGPDQAVSFIEFGGT